MSFKDNTKNCSQNHANIYRNLYNKRHKNKFYVQEYLHFICEEQYQIFAWLMRLNNTKFQAVYKYQLRLQNFNQNNQTTFSGCFAAVLTNRHNQYFPVTMWVKSLNFVTCQISTTQSTVKSSQSTGRSARELVSLRWPHSPTSTTVTSKSQSILSHRRSVRRLVDLRRPHPQPQHRTSKPQSITINNRYNQQQSTINTGSIHDGQLHSSM